MRPILTVRLKDQGSDNEQNCYRVAIFLRSALMRAGLKTGKIKETQMVGSGLLTECEFESKTFELIVGLMPFGGSEGIEIMLWKKDSILDRFLRRKPSKKENEIWEVIHEFTESSDEIIGKKWFADARYREKWPTRKPIPES